MDCIIGGILFVVVMMVLPLVFLVLDGYVPSHKRDQTCHFKKRLATCTRSEDGYCAECHSSYYH